MRRVLLLALLLSGCASVRSHSIFSLQFSEQPPRAAVRAQCNGENFTTQGTVVCEQKAPSQAQVQVKIPPVEGRVVFSNGQLKKTADFNWYPKEGFWLWKKVPIKDTWIPLDLGEIASTFGDWPVAIDIVGNDPDVGVIVTRGLLYYRVCNDKDIPCSHLVVNFECAGYEHSTGLNNIGKCERLSGSTQAFRVQLKGPDYQATPGAKIYVVASRMGVSDTFVPQQSDFDAGEMKVEIPLIPSGPTLVGIRMAWVENGAVKQVETRVLVVGYSPQWTGMDQPHYLVDGDDLQFVKPVFSDLMETDLYDDKKALLQKKFGNGKVVTLPKPQAGQVSCAFAWQRDSSDQTILCLDSNLKEVKFP